MCWPRSIARKNTDDAQRLTTIVRALQALAAERQVVWPLHPRTRGILARLGLLDELASTVTLLEPVGYLDMVQLEKYAALIATDSGGVQKKRVFHRIPCVTLRDESRMDRAGRRRLESPGAAGVQRRCRASRQDALREQPRDVQPYGDGQAARRIVDALAAH